MDGGMNIVFLAGFLDRVTLSKRLPYEPHLPELHPPELPPLP
jgi:hypothetical protein